MGQSQAPRQASAFDERVGLRVHHARKRAGLSQGTLGAGVGVSFQQIQKYEQGKSRIAVATLHRIAAAVGVPAASLLDEAEARDGFRSESVRLLEAFDRIDDATVRQRLLDLAESLADATADGRA